MNPGPVASHTRQSRCSNALPFFLRILSIALLVLAPAVALAQATGTIAGRVSNQATGEYLRNAQVSVAGTKISTTAGDGGYFRLADVPAGDVKLVVTYSGLDPAEVTVAVPAGGNVTSDVALTSEAYAKDDIIRLGEYVVTTEREGNAKAIMDQKMAVNMKRVVATDAFGDIAEGNVGEFLKMMPGVQIDYVEADARTVSIRGLDPKYSSILMDGMPIASTSSSNLNAAGSRAFEFEQISIAAIETVELSKTPTPDVAANSVAGVVNMRSKGAFDSKGRRIYASTSIGINEYYASHEKEYFLEGEKTWQIPLNAQIGFSDVFLKGRLGVQAGLLYSEAVTGQKHIRPSYAGWNNDPLDNATEVRRVQTVNYRDGPKRTTRINGNLRFDYKFTPNFRAYLRADANDYDALFQLHDVNVSLGTPVTTDPAVPYTKLSQTATGSSIRSSNAGSNNKYGTTNTVAAGFEAEIRSLRINGDFSISTSFNHYRDIDKGFWAVLPGTTGPGGYTIQWTRPSADSTEFRFIQLVGTGDWRDQGSWLLNNGTNASVPTTNYDFRTQPRDSRDQRKTGRLDLRYPLQGRFPTVFKSGLSTTTSKRTNKREEWRYQYRGADGMAGTADDRSVFYYPLRTKFDMGGNVDGMLVPDNYAWGRLYQEHPEYWTLAEIDKLRNELGAPLLLDETVSGAYLQAIVKIGRKLTVAPGFRWETTDWTAESNKDIGRRAAMTAIGLPNTTAESALTAAQVPAYWRAKIGQRIDIGKEYDDLFRYLHVTYDINEEWKARASFHQGITRPDPSRLLPTFRVTQEAADSGDGLGTISAGNPDINPEMSNNLNFSLEYYPSKVGYFTVTYWQSKLKDSQTSVSFDLDEDGYDGDTTYAYWHFNTSFNSGKAKRSGWEIDASRQLDFLPGFLRNLRVAGNITLIDYALPEWGIDGEWASGRPTRLANFIVSHSYRGWSGNIRVNWTGSRAMTAYDRARGTRDYVKDQLRLDVNLRRRLTKNLTLFLSGRNILNEPLYEYSTNKDYFSRIAKFGAAWTIGCEGRF